MLLCCFLVVYRMSKSEYQDEAVVYQLKQELHEKDLRLTDIQLEALSSAHQLEQLCETMNRMKVTISLHILYLQSIVSRYQLVGKVKLMSNGLIGHW